MDKQLDMDVAEEPAKTPDFAADAALLGLMNDVFDDSVQLDWVKEHLLSGSASREESGPNLASLYDALGIDRPRHSNWSGGKLRKDRKNALSDHTRDLQDLFSREGRYYNKDNERQKTVRQFRKKLIDHWVNKDKAKIAVITRGLETHAAKLSGEKAKEKDAATAKRIAAIMQDSMPNPDYTRSLSPENLPTSLEEVFDAFDREKIVNLLVDQFENPQTRGAVTAITGPPKSGKSSVLRAFVGKVAETAANWDSPPSLLYIDLTSAATPQRAIYLALKGLGNGSLAPADAAGLADDSSDEGDQDTFAWSDAISYVKAVLPPPAPGAAQLVVVEGCHTVAKTEDIKSSIQSLIELHNFRSSSFFLEDYHGTFKPRGVAPAELHLPPYSDGSARDFLTGPCQVPADLAHPAIEEISGLGELFYPGPLNNGSFAFRKEHLPYRSDLADAESLSMSILEAASGIVSYVVEGVLQGDSDAAHQVFQSLKAMSVVGTISVSDEALNTAGLSPIPRDALQRMGWFSGAQHPRLIGFALQGLRAAVVQELKTAKNGEETEFVDAVKLLVETLGSVEGAGHERAIEEAASWLGRTVPQDTPLLVHLRVKLYGFSPDDEVAPLSQEQELLSEPLFQKAALEDRDLEAAIAWLVLTARKTKEDSVVARSEFLDALTALMDILNEDAGLNHPHFSAIDRALHFGLRRYQALDEILDARHRILALLDVPNADSRAVAQVGRFPRVQAYQEAMASFQINTAEALISLGDTASANELAGKVSATLVSIHEADRTSYTYWRLARLAILRSRLAQDVEDRCKRLRSVCDLAQQCLKSAPGDVRNVKFLLRNVRRFMEEEGKAHIRQEVIDEVIALLTSLYGAPQNWGLEVRGRVAALLRRLVRFEGTSDRQDEIARKAMDILVPDPDFTDDDLDDMALLTKARLHAALGQSNAARKATNRVLEKAPSTEAWLLKLRLENGDVREIASAATRISFELLEAKQIGDALRIAMTDAENWIQELPELERKSPEVTKLLLWIRKRRWSSEGSILKSVRDQIELEGGDFNRLKLEDRLAKLDREFRQRESSLNGISRISSGSTELLFEKAMNCSQFVRSKALVSGQEPEVDMVLKVFEKGLEENPNSGETLLHLAEYQRYIWRIEDATDNFRKALRHCHSAELRQMATFGLARTLHTSCVELDDVDETERSARLDEAMKLVSSMSETLSDVPEVLLLREHIAFESGSSVDWVELDAVCEKVAGNADGYLPSLLANLEILGMPDDEAPLTMAEALTDDYTSRDVLGSVAQLYFRRGLKGTGNQTASYFMRAAALQSGVAMLERSWLGTEMATTRYHLAQTISVAADRFNDPNPIDGLWIGNKENQLHFAEAKFHGAAMASVGGFRAKARQMQAYVAQQKRALGQ